MNRFASLCCGWPSVQWLGAAFIGWGGPGHVNAQRLELGFGSKVVGEDRLTYKSTIHLKYEGGTMFFLPRILYRPEILSFLQRS